MDQRQVAPAGDVPSVDQTPVTAAPVIAIDGSGLNEQPVNEGVDDSVEPDNDGTEPDIVAEGWLALEGRLPTTSERAEVGMVTERFGISRADAVRASIRQQDSLETVEALREYFGQRLVQSEIDTETGGLIAWVEDEATAKEVRDMGYQVKMATMEEEVDLALEQARDILDRYPIEWPI